MHVSGHEGITIGQNRISVEIREVYHSVCPLNVKILLFFRLICEVTLPRETFSGRRLYPHIVY